MSVLGLRQCVGITAWTWVVLLVAISTALAAPRSYSHEASEPVFEGNAARPRRHIDDNSIEDELDEIEWVKNEKSKAWPKKWHGYEDKLRDYFRNIQKAASRNNFRPGDSQVPSEKSANEGSDMRLRGDQGVGDVSTDEEQLGIKNKEILSKIWKALANSKRLAKINREEKDEEDVMGANYDSYEALFIFPPFTEVQDTVESGDCALCTVLDTFIQSFIFGTQEPTYQGNRQIPLMATESWGLSTGLAPSSSMTKPQGLPGILRLMSSVLQSLSSFQSTNMPINMMRYPNLPLPLFYSLF